MRTTLVKATEVFRNFVTKLIYIGANTKTSFTLWPVPDNGGTPDTAAANLYLYQVTAIQNTGSYYDISTSIEYFADPTYFSETNWDTTNLRIVYDQTAVTSINFLTAGYYVLIAPYNPTASSIILTFTSETYTCPYDSNYADVYSNMQPCQHFPVSQEGFPCQKFDSVNRVCLFCFTGFRLVNGSCLYDDTCGDREYFDFGKCLPVDDACDEFDIFTGYCKTCKLNASTISPRGKCEEIPVVCGDRQYLKDRMCLNVSSLCDDFDNLTGKCESCIEDYKLEEDGTCSKIIIVCKVNEYKDGKECKKIPEECVSYDKVAFRCLKCLSGWWPSSLGVCQKIHCPDR